MNIAKIIREGREKLDLNQSQLAKLVGVSPQAVQQWEAGVTQPRGKRLNKIAQVLKLPPALMHFGALPEKPGAAGMIQEPAGTHPAAPAISASLKPAKKNPGELPEGAAESPASTKDALIKEVINAMQRMSKEDAARLVKISNALVGASGEEPQEAEEIELKPLPKADLAPHPPPAFPPRRVSSTSAKTRGKTAIR